jgi:pyrroloquinoline quinone (PQQ) biosynthesis protein C
MARDLDVFRKRYPWVDDDALEFYKLHAGVDVEHGVIRQQILKQYANTKELQEECINAQLMKNNVRRVMADAIYMAYVVQTSLWIRAALRRNPLPNFFSKKSCRVW